MGVEEVMSEERREGANPGGRQGVKRAILMVFYSWSLFVVALAFLYDPLLRGVCEPRLVERFVLVFGALYAPVAVVAMGIAYRERKMVRISGEQSLY